MFFRFMLNAALIASAAFVFSCKVSAQAPIIDAGVDSGQPARSGAYAATNTQANPAPPPLAQNSAADQGELFYQLQLLQQEVMQLRGQIEEQGYQLQQLKEQSMERYIDMDRRLGSLATKSGTANTNGSNISQSPKVVSVQAVAKAGEKEAYDRAYGMVINKQFDDALNAFKQFLLDFPDGKFAPNSYYWMGELYQVITPANLSGAREALSQLLSQYPDHAKAPDAMYKLGKVYFLMGNKTASRDWLEKVINYYGNGANSAAADKARQFLNANF